MGKIEKEKYANAKLNKFFIVWTVMYFIFCIGGAKYDNRIMGAIFYVGAYLYHPFRGIVLFVNFIAGCREKNREKNFKYIFFGDVASICVYIYGMCTAFNHIQGLHLFILPIEMFIVGFYNIVAVATSALRSFKDNRLLILITALAGCGFFIHLYLLISGVVFDKIRIYI